MRNSGKMSIPELSVPLFIHPLCTHCVRIIYALPIKHPYTVISSALKVLNCIKPYEQMNFPTVKMSICNIYEQQTVSVHYHSINVCGILSASSWAPLNLHPLPLKTERGRKDKVHVSLHIVSFSLCVHRSMGPCI